MIDDLKKYWNHKNPTLPFTFSAADGKAVADWLKINREWTQEMWRKALNNRGKSDKIHSQRIYLWIGRLNEYYDSPLDGYGHPMLNGGGASGKAADIEQRNRAARESVVGSVCP